MIRCRNPPSGLLIGVKLVCVLGLMGTLQVATIVVLHVKGLALRVGRARGRNCCNTTTHLAVLLVRSLIILVLAVNFIARNARALNQLIGTCTPAVHVERTLRHSTVSFMAFASVKIVCHGLGV
jgi:hypothetical protein